MRNTRELILLKLKARDATMQDASLAIGRNPAFVQQYIKRGSPKFLAERDREALARFLAISPDDLRENAKAPSIAVVGPRLSRAPANENISYSATPRDLPVLGGALCGDDGLFEFNGQALDYARRLPRLIGVKDAYALYANGDSMTPWREPGDLVFVHPHLPVKPGDYVVVQLHPPAEGAPSPAYIKRLVRRSASEIRLLQYNPKKELSLPMRKVMAVHKVLDWSELMGM